MPDGSTLLLFAGASLALLGLIAASVTAFTVDIGLGVTGALSGSRPTHS
jgi:hypothetical protein